MRAVELEETDPAEAVAEQHEVLAHDPERERHVVELSREGDGLPEAAQVLAARRARAHARELGVRRGHVRAR